MFLLKLLFHKLFLFTFIISHQSCPFLWHTCNIKSCYSCMLSFSSALWEILPRATLNILWWSSTWGPSASREDYWSDTSSAAPSLSWPSCWPASTFAITSVSPSQMSFSVTSGLERFSATPQYLRPCSASWWPWASFSSWATSICVCICCWCHCACTPCWFRSEGPWASWNRTRCYPL